MQLPIEMVKLGFVCGVIGTLTAFACERVRASPPPDSPWCIVGATTNNQYMVYTEAECRQYEKDRVVVMWLDRNGARRLSDPWSNVKERDLLRRTLPW